MCKYAHDFLHRRSFKNLCVSESLSLCVSVLKFITECVLWLVGVIGFRLKFLAGASVQTVHEPFAGIVEAFVDQQRVEERVLDKVQRVEDAAHEKR